MAKCSPTAIFDTFWQFVILLEIEHTTSAFFSSSDASLHCFDSESCLIGGRPSVPPSTIDLQGVERSPAAGSHNHLSSAPGPRPPRDAAEVEEVEDLDDRVHVHAPMG